MKRQEALALLYHFEPEREAVVRQALRSCKIAARRVPDADIGQKIGYLAGWKGFKRAQGDGGAPFGEEVLVLQGVQGKLLDEMLLQFEAAGISRIRLKAIVTPYNALWTLRRLCETIQKEHGAMLKDA